MFIHNFWGDRGFGNNFQWNQNYSFMFKVSPKADLFSYEKGAKGKQSKCQWLNFIQHFFLNICETLTEIPRVWQ